MCPCVPDQIGIWKCWFLRRGKNRSTRRKTSWSKGENGTNNKLNPHMESKPGSKPGPHWWRRRVLSPLCHHCSHYIQVHLIVQLVYLEIESWNSIIAFGFAFPCSFPLTVVFREKLCLTRGILFNIIRF